MSETELNSLEVFRKLKFHLIHEILNDDILQRPSIECEVANTALNVPHAKRFEQFNQFIVSLMVGYLDAGFGILLNHVEDNGIRIIFTMIVSNDYVAVIIVLKVTLKVINNILGLCKLHALDFQILLIRLVQKEIPFGRVYVTEIIRTSEIKQGMSYRRQLPEFTIDYLVEGNQCM